MTTQASMDSKVDAGIQQREIAKLRSLFYKQLQQHYSQRKHKELITLGCADKCMKSYSFREDDITKNESVCLQNCMHKYYRYLAYGNTLYSFLVSTDGAVDKFIED